MSEHEHQQRVLIVDDARVNRYILERYIQKVDSKIICDQASNGMEAVELCKKHTYDLILMDLKMPEMNGFSSAAAILLLAPNARIVAVTGSVEEASVHQAHRVGMIGVLTKPLQMNVLRDYIQRKL